MLADLQILVGAIIQPLRHSAWGGRRYCATLAVWSGDCGWWACRKGPVAKCGGGLRSKKQTRWHQPRTIAARSAQIPMVIHMCVNLSELWGPGSASCSCGNIYRAACRSLSSSERVSALGLAWVRRALPPAGSPIPLQMWPVYLADDFVMEKPARPACGHSILCRPIVVPYRQKKG